MPSWTEPFAKEFLPFSKKTGITTQRIGHTHLRKFISTRTYENATQEYAQEVQKAMSHSEQTRKRCYVCKDYTQTGSAAIRIIKRVIQPTAQEKKDQDNGQKKKKTRKKERRKRY